MIFFLKLFVGDCDERSDAGDIGSMMSGWSHLHKTDMWKR